MNQRPPRTLSTLKAMMLLLGVAILACCVILVVMKYSDVLTKDTSTVTPVTPNRPSLTDISLPRSLKNDKLFLGGENNESILTTLHYNTYTIIVGSTDSILYDMTSFLTGQNIFVAIINANNTLQQVLLCGTNGIDTPVSARFGTQGLVIFSNCETGARVYLLDLEGFTIKELPLPFESSARGIDAYFADNKLYFVANLHGTLAVSCLGETPILLGQAKYCAMYPSSDGVRIFASTATTGIVYMISGQRVKQIETEKFDYVVPYQNGFAASCINEILILASDMRVNARIAHPKTGNSIKLVPIADTLLYIVCGKDSAAYTIIGSHTISTEYGGGEILNVSHDGNYLTLHNNELFHNTTKITSLDGVINAQYVTNGFVCVARGVIGGTDIFYFPL